MNPKDTILLPGTGRQVQILLENIKEEIKSILIIGPGAVKAGKILRDHYKSEIIEIVEDQDSLLTERLNIKGEKNISVMMMDYANTDFKKGYFDLVFAQASVSVKKRNKIIKEVKRILKPGGIFCVGEITTSVSDSPPFIKNIWEISEMLPLTDDEIIPYYTNMNFVLLLEEDLSSTLSEYYSKQAGLLSEFSGELTTNEKSYYKKLMNRISHESNAYLKLGGHKYMRFRMFILKKSEE